jgi:hypothetical protein
LIEHRRLWLVRLLLLRPVRAPATSLDRRNRLSSDYPISRLHCLRRFPFFDNTHNWPKIGTRGGPIRSQSRPPKVAQNRDSEFEMNGEDTMTGRQGMLTLPGIILLLMCLIMIGGMFSGLQLQPWGGLLYDGGLRRRAPGARRLPKFKLSHYPKRQIDWAAAKAANSLNRLPSVIRAKLRRMEFANNGRMRATVRDKRWPGSRFYACLLPGVAPSGSFGRRGDSWLGKRGDLLCDPVAVTAVRGLRAES